MLKCCCGIIFGQHFLKPWGFTQNPMNFWKSSIKTFIRYHDCRQSYFIKRKGSGNEWVSRMESAVGIHFRRRKQQVSRLLSRWNLSVYSSVWTSRNPDFDLGVELCRHPQTVTLVTVFRSYFYTSTGCKCHISSAYSFIVRSELNFPLMAMFSAAIFAHRFLSL